MILAKKPKPKKCPICAAMFVRTRAIQPCCLSLECQIEYSARLSIKRKAAAEKLDRIDTRQRKEKLKSKSEVAKEVQVLCNRYVRERDLKAGHGCISCGTQSTPRWDAGHFRSVGSAPNLRFDHERNIHLQCAKCNTFLAGNLMRYGNFLPYRIGKEAFDALLSDNEPKHYTIEDLRQLKEVFKEKIRNLQKDAG